MEYFGFSLGPIIVTILRILVPLLIFKYPLKGGILAQAFDVFDFVMVDDLGGGGYRNYHFTDKLLDTYFLTIMVAYSYRHWKGLERNVSLALFGWRLIGVVMFEMTGIRWILLLFPNLFLWWWFFVSIRDYSYPKWKITPLRATIVLLILLIPKLAQEYFLHIAQGFHYLGFNMVF